MPWDASYSFAKRGGRGVTIALLHAAYNIKREIPDVPLKGVQLDLTMTLPPRVSVSFVNNVVAAA